MEQTILVVDDQFSMQEWIRSMLLSAGYNVITADDGTAGIYLAQTEHPILTMVDFNLPRMSGMEFYQCLHNNPQTSNIPVLFITNEDTGVDNACSLRKPFSRKSLLYKVEQMIPAHV